MLEIFYKFLSGGILSSFVVYPALADPRAITESVSVWLVKVQPIVSDIIGGVI